MARRKKVYFGVLCVACLCVSVSLALESEGLISENTASPFFVQRASEIHNDDPLDPMKVEQAMAFLEAASSLMVTPSPIAEQMLRIGGKNCYVGQDYSKNLTWALDRYLNSRSDLVIVSDALGCILENLQTRIERETFIQKLLQNYSAVNPGFTSDLATHYGLLCVEKGDFQSALFSFSSAISMNPYNGLALSKYVELSEGTEDTPSPSSLVLLTRTSLVTDPYDLNAAVKYANVLMQFEVYDTAANSFAYAAKVHQYLYPDARLPEDIVHGWLLSCFRGEHLETKCLEVAEAHRDPERLDLMLEAVAGKALIKIGKIDNGRRVLDSAAQKAETLLSSDDLQQSIHPEYLAWFYSFIQESPEKALAWSNRAFQEDPNRMGVREIFAYTLALNGQFDLAEQYAEPLEVNTQTSELTRAMVALSKDQKQTALDTLRSVVAMSPESFISEKAIGILNEQESSYISPVDAVTIQSDLQREYGDQAVPKFMVPSERYSAKLLFNGSDFLYGGRFDSRLVIENTSPDALVVAEDGFLHGYVRIDAVIEGDLNVTFPNLLSFHFRPSKPIMPGQHVSQSLDLDTGRLKKLLMTYPQADVKIHFTGYLDPFVTPSGDIRNRLDETEPIHSSIHRKGVLLSRNFLMQRLDVLSKGQTGQKYQAASLFTGLLAEQKTLQLSGAGFKHVQVEPSLLVDAVRSVLTDKDWKVRVHALDCLVLLSIPLEADIIRDITKNLNHDKWPVRLMAMYFLAKSQPESFQKVLDWTGQHDPQAFNRRMAVRLGAREIISDEMSTAKADD